MGHIALGYRLYLGPTRYPYCYRVSVPYLHSHHALGTIKCQVVLHTFYASRVFSVSYASHVFDMSLCTYIALCIDILMQLSGQS